MIAAALRGGNKPSLNEALGWIGWRVDDIFGAGVGRLEDVWIDPGTGEPRWLLVNAGRFGGRSTLIPFDDATAGTGHVWVPYEREIVLGAPAVEPGAPLTDQVETELQSHYSMHARSAGAEGRGAGGPGALGELRYREPDPSDDLATGPAGREPSSGARAAGRPGSPDPAAPPAAQPARGLGPADAAPRLPARPAPPSPASASRDPQAAAEPAAPEAFGPPVGQASSGFEGSARPGERGPAAPAAGSASPGTEGDSGAAPASAQPAAGWQHDYSQATEAARSAGPGSEAQPAEAVPPSQADERRQGAQSPGAGADATAATAAGASPATPAAAGIEGAPASEGARQMVEIQLAGNLTIRGELVNLRIFSSDPE